MNSGGACICPLHLTTLQTCEWPQRSPSPFVETGSWVSQTGSYKQCVSSLWIWGQMWNRTLGSPHRLILIYRIDACLLGFILKIAFTSSVDAWGLLFVGEVEIKGKEVTCSPRANSKELREFRKLEQVVSSVWWSCIKCQLCVYRWAL